MGNKVSLTLRLILGDQLHSGHSWFETVDPSVRYVMMEVRDEASYVLHHAQKIIGIFAGSIFYLPCFGIFKVFYCLLARF